jgi:hypothetical protein
MLLYEVTDTDGFLVFFLLMLLFEVTDKKFIYYIYITYLIVINLYITYIYNLSHSHRLKCKKMSLFNLQKKKKKVIVT